MQDQGHCCVVSTCGALDETRSDSPLDPYLVCAFEAEAYRQRLRLQKFGCQSRLFSIIQPGQVYPPVGVPHTGSLIRQFKNTTHIRSNSQGFQDSSLTALIALIQQIKYHNRLQTLEQNDMQIYSALKRFLCQHLALTMENGKKLCTI